MTTYRHTRDTYDPDDQAYDHPDHPCSASGAKDAQEQTKMEYLKGFLASTKKTFNIAIADKHLAKDAKSCCGCDVWARSLNSMLGKIAMLLFLLSCLSIYDDHRFVKIMVGNDVAPRSSLSNTNTAAVVYPAPTEFEWPFAQRQEVYNALRTTMVVVPHRAMFATSSADAKIAFCNTYITLIGGTTTVLRSCNDCCNKGTDHHAVLVCIAPNIFKH